jgi:hypothetical protein
MTDTLLRRPDHLSLLLACAARYGANTTLLSVSRFSRAAPDSQADIGEVAALAREGEVTDPVAAARLFTLRRDAT